MLFGFKKCGLRKEVLQKPPKNSHFYILGLSLVVKLSPPKTKFPYRVYD